MSSIDKERLRSMKRPYIDRAPHVGPEGDPTVELCMQVLLQPGELHSVAQITSGIQDFVTDVFDDPALRSKGVGDSVERLRGDCRSVARLVSHFMAAQDQRLEEVRTGRLIRVVLHAEGGAILCFSVVPGQYIVGFTFSSLLSDQSSAEPSQGELSRVSATISADQVMSRLVDNLRKQVGLRTQNPGGWHELAQQQVDDATTGLSELPWAEGSSPPTGGSGSPLSDLCRNEVDPADLHLVSHYRGSELEFTVDHLGDKRLGRFFGLMTVDARRKFYGDYGLELADVVCQLGRLTRSSVGGRLLRLVLDVEQGAIYYYRLQVNDYLVGVTLDQNQVSAADDKMASLALRCRRFLSRHGTDEQRR